jgi:cytochrome c556
LRDAAAALARSAGSQDYARSKAGLADVANSCNRCHRTFRVATRIGPAAREDTRP